MPQTIKEVYNRFPRISDEAEKTLSREIYRDEVGFLSQLNDAQKEEYLEIRRNNFHLNRLTDEKAFEHGFYIAYRLMQEMNEGVKGTYNTLDYLSLD